MSCGSERSDSTGERSEAAIERTAEQDGVRLSLRVTPKEPTMGGRATVTVTAETEPGVSPELPDYADQLAKQPFEYKITDKRVTPPKQLENGRVQWTWAYQIEFFLPGRYDLPTPTLTWQRDTDDSDDDSSTATQPPSLAPEPITLTVRAGEAGELDDESLTEVPIADPVSLPREPFDWRRHWWIPVVGVTVVALAALLLARWMKRRGQPPLARPVPAHEWAMEQIAALMAEKLVERGLHQAFFYRLSDIVRGYVERRFGVSAPEMTTEEFLAAMSGDARFRPEHRDLLQRFLRDCDMVKYARHQPDPTEYDQATGSAGDFVKQTTESPTETETAGATRAEGGT